MGRLVGPHEKRAPAALPRSLATQTLSCATRSFRCKARPNQRHAPQVGGGRWACSRLGRLANLVCPSDARIKPRQSQKFAVASNHPTTQYAREGFPAGARDYLRAWVRVRPRTYWGSDDA
jgi:hypothetical protein